MEDIINTSQYLPTRYSKIHILDTDIVEPELLISRIADEVSESHPEYFNSESHYVFYRLRYVPPHTEFQELRNLIVKIRQASIIRSEYHGIIAIDVSQFKGHEDEEYFTAILKYLFDNTANCTTLLVCCQYTEQEISKLANEYMKSLKHFSIAIKRLHIFQEDCLKNLIVSSFKDNNISIDSTVASLIVESLLSNDLFPYRSLQLIDSLTHEIKNCDLNVNEYFQNPQSGLCIMAGHPLLPLN